MPTIIHRKLAFFLIRVRVQVRHKNLPGFHERNHVGQRSVYASVGLYVKLDLKGNLASNCRTKLKKHPSFPKESLNYLVRKYEMLSLSLLALHRRFYVIQIYFLLKAQ